jgi:hypothetical protein
MNVYVNRSLSPAWTTLAALALLIATPTAFAVSPAPDEYQLTGDQTSVLYDTTGIDGKPHFTYQHAGNTQTFSGDEIRTVGTEIGTLVSVTLALTVDSGSTSFTVLIPHVNLNDKLHATIKTEGITTQHRFSVNPNLLKGQLDQYTYLRLKGTARYVQF